MKKFLFALLLLALWATACKDNEPVTPTGEYSAELNTFTDVIVGTYQDLDNKAAILVTALTALENNPSPQNLEAARQAWRDTRRPWEQSEGFLFGPVSQLAIDPSIDNWPLSITDLNNVLASNDALTKPYLDSQEGTLKGFHTIEYLIFGADGTKTVADFTSREFEYLRATGESLRGETTKLYTAWIESGGNFAQNLRAAGTSASIYPSQKAALQELVNGIVGIADEVANGKINTPYSEKDVTKEESRFSANSKADFADNIRSIRNIYFGTRDGSHSSTSLHELVEEKNGALDTKISNQIDDAIEAIEGIPGTFTTAIFDHGDAIENAQTKVRDLQETLQAELLPFVQAL